MEKIAVIILNWNQSQLTIECLDSVFKSELPANFQAVVIVVDNNSSVKEKEILTNYLEKAGRQLQANFRCQLIENQKNFGFAGGDNIGIKSAIRQSCDYLFLLNNDTEIKNDCLKNLLRELKKNKNIGVVSPKIYYARGYEYHLNRYQPKELGHVIWFAGGKIDWHNLLGAHIGVDKVDKGQYDQIKTIDFATGCAFLTKKEVFERVGVFDERFFLYLEDLDFSLRIRKNNFKIKFIPQAVVYHKNAASSGSGSVLHDYYFTRNRLLFAQKHASIKLKLLLYKQALSYFFGQDKIRKQAVKDYLLQKFGYKNTTSIE